MQTAFFAHGGTGYPATGAHPRGYSWRPMAHIQSAPPRRLDSFHEKQSAVFLYERMPRVRFPEWLLTEAKVDAG